MSKVKLSDIATVAAGNVAPEAKDFTSDGVPFVRAGSLSGLLETGDFSQLETIDPAAASRLRLKLFPAGTVVFAKSGMSCLKGHVYTLPRECYVVSHLACITPKEGYSEYLKHYFRYWKPNRLIDNPSFPSIKLGKISDIELDLPDDDRAQEIVANLEAT